MNASYGINKSSGRNGKTRRMNTYKRIDSGWAPPACIMSEATRLREREMRKFKSIGRPRRFVTVHAVVQNLFNRGRQLG